MTMSFEFDERGLRDAVREGARAGMQDIADELNERMRALAHTMRGADLAEIKTALQAEWRRDGGDLTEPKLTEYALVIQEGGSVNFVVDASSLRGL